MVLGLIQLVGPLVSPGARAGAGVSDWSSGAPPLPSASVLLRMWWGKVSLVSHLSHKSKYLLAASPSSICRFKLGERGLKQLAYGFLCNASAKFNPLTEILGFVAVFYIVGLFRHTTEINFMCWEWFLGCNFWRYLYFYCKCTTYCVWNIIKNWNIPQPDPQLGPVPNYL